MVYTKGNVIVDQIKVGDIHYEYELGVCLKVKVLSLPVQDGEEWTWDAEIISTGKIIHYSVNEKYSHYSVNLYDYEAYKVNTII